jgi:hypothetical protein
MKLVALILGLLLITTNGWWFYQSIDRGITAMYQGMESYQDANRIVALSTLATEFTRGIPKSEAKAVLQKLFPESEAYEKDGMLNTTWISLSLAPDGRVLGVELEEGAKLRAQPHNPAR